jgi:2-keto-3-deoxy-L-rhamnonate aldolase RhmA
MGAIRRENTLKQRLYVGKAAFGVMGTFPSPPVVEMLGYLWFDCMLLDNEHGSMVLDPAESCIATANVGQGRGGGSLCNAWSSI